MHSYVQVLVRQRENKSEISSSEEEHTNKPDPLRLWKQEVAGLGTALPL